MRPSRVKGLVFTLFLLWAGLVSLPALSETFVFTAIPDQDESRLRERFGKAADYLAERLEVDVRYVPVKSYAAAVSAFRNGQVQLAWLGGLSGVRARQLVPGSDAIVQGAEDRAFVTYFIAHESTGLQRQETFPAGIAGLTFTFGSKGSTSGRLMPEYYIRKHFGKRPEEVFARVGFSGDHSRTIALVQSGAYKVGALSYEVWETELELGKVDASRVRVIWATPPYSDYHWTIRGDVNARFGDGFKERVTRALLEMDDPVLLRSFSRSRFVPASDEDYEPIAKTAKEVGLID